MRYEWLIFIGSCLLLVGCSKSGTVAAAPTQTPSPAISATATYIEGSAVRSTATAEVRMAVQETVKLVGTWAVTMSPTHTMAFGNFDDRTNIVTIMVDPDLLQETTTYDVQVGETIPRDAWPQSLLDALAEQDPRVEVKLIPERVIMTNTVTISTTSAPTAALVQWPLYRHEQLGVAFRHPPEWTPYDETPAFVRFADADHAAQPKEAFNVVNGGFRIESVSDFVEQISLPIVMTETLQIDGQSAIYLQLEEQNPGEYQSIVGILTPHQRTVTLGNRTVDSSTFKQILSTIRFFSPMRAP